METEVVQFLRDELVKRVEKNPRYSMRAFAKSLGMNIGSLSGLLSGKRRLTPTAAEKLCGLLAMTPAEKSEIILSAVAPLGKSGIGSTGAYESQRLELEEERFRVISDWYHWAILQLVRTEKYLHHSKCPDAKWIARQLGISQIDAKLALDRLLKLNLLTLNGKGFYQRTKAAITTADKETTSVALRRGQKQIREKAVASLENDPIEVRSMTGMTMAIDPKKIKEAKRLIDKFQEDLSAFLERGKKEQVYQLCVSLFPLQIREN